MAWVKRRLWYLITPVLFYIGSVYSSCECGYTVNSTSDPEHAVFTDLLESDFLKLTDLPKQSDWLPQEWELNPEKSLGPFGRLTRREAIMFNQPRDLTVNGTGRNSGPAGMYLVVPSGTYELDGVPYLAGAELDTKREDIIYGSFRIGFQMTTQPGTCFGFYWYHDDKQEIDIEVLSRQVNQTDSLINLVLHTPVGGDNMQALPGTYEVVDVPYDLSNGIHELRVDWTPIAITWYADGKQLWSITNTTLFPSEPGKLVITHWSNGNPLWSGGPPPKNAAVTMTYVKSYFNSSNPQRQIDHKRRCEAVRSDSTAFCEIPAQDGPPNYYNTPKNYPYFFSEDKVRNATYNQTTYPAMGSRVREGLVSKVEFIWVIQLTAAIVLTLDYIFSPLVYF